MKREAHCAECGQPFTRRRAEAVFCSPGCRKEFNNRRMQRGAELYDLFMVMRFDRAAAKELGVWKRACRMASGFRDQDRQHREGRPSWRKPGTIMARRADLAADYCGQITSGRRRR